MLDRRQFVKISAGAAMGGLLGGDSAPLFGVTRPAADRALDRIGVQLYTVRSLLERDFEGTLAAVAEIGYREWEFHDYFGRTPQQVRGLLDQLGIDAPAAHFRWPDLQNDLGAVIETALVIGHRYVILPWLPPEDRATLDQYRYLADFCNRAGETCRQAGLRFGYHHHDWEFQPLEGEVPFDLMLAETDPDLVEFEMDLYWITKGGRSPFEYFDSHPGRFTLCHVKDMGRDRSWADVGSGSIDFASIFARSEQAGLRYYFVEHDEPADPLASIAASLDHLESLKF
jgi:sugar phosphate isomerase/epimerase